MSKEKLMRPVGRTGHRVKPLIALATTVLLTIACAISLSNPPEEQLGTQVAATLSALAPAATGTDTPAPSSQPTSSATVTAASSIASATPAPPSDGISLNCDGTYQRVRFNDQGAAGTSLRVDQWAQGEWRTAWQFETGDPEIRRLADQAGAYQFGDCQRLIVLPILYSGSGSVLELRILQWDGESAVEVYTNDGTHGQWSIVGDRVHFERSLYLYQEPNCCPCNRESREHEWNGRAFIQVESEIKPTYTGTPPPICTP